MDAAICLARQLGLTERSSLLNIRSYLESAYLGCSSLCSTAGRMYAAAIAMSATATDVDNRMAFIGLLPAFPVSPMKTLILDFCSVHAVKHRLGPNSKREGTYRRYLDQNGTLENITSLDRRI